MCDQASSARRTASDTCSIRWDVNVALQSIQGLDSNGTLIPDSRVLTGGESVLIAAPVPEPGSLAIVGSALLALRLRRNRH
ncbi:MAG: PEP-CTERM sorting domain-containing protein [Bryobacteraceae bacterium]|nr:PEP-CTERM sorting domain-containing protein [Bryobacteraceae bacterium]